MSTQASLEQKLLQIILRLGPTPPMNAFGNISDWRVDLSGNALLLNPVERRWYWMDVLHQQWKYSGFSSGEALFIADGKKLGAKRLPRGSEGPIERWCVCLTNSGPMGPILKSDLAAKIGRGEVAGDATAWSADATNCRAAHEVAGLTPSIADSMSLNEVGRRRGSRFAAVLSIITIVALLLAGGITWYLLREDSNSPQALYQQAMALVNSGRPDEGVALCQQSADMGCADAQFYLGQRYLEQSRNYDAPHQFENFIAGTDLLRKAARAGHAGAREELLRMREEVRPEK